MSSDDQAPNSTQDDESQDDGVAAAELEGAALRGPVDEAELGAGKKSLGLDRWVQLVYIVAAITLVWLFDHVISSIWYVFADPDEALVTLGAIVCGVIATGALYRQPVVHATVHDTVDELSKVSWPTRNETSSSTIIVVVTSVVAALMLFLFDSVWSAVTDLVYKV
jgi:preprotein translocase subunit SecE